MLLPGGESLFPEGDAPAVRHAPQLGAGLALLGIDGTGGLPFQQDGHVRRLGQDGLYHGPLLGGEALKAPDEHMGSLHQSAGFQPLPGQVDALGGVQPPLPAQTEIFPVDEPQIPDLGSRLLCSEEHFRGDGAGLQLPRQLHQPGRQLGAAGLAVIGQAGAGGGEGPVHGEHPSPVVQGLRQSAGALQNVLCQLAEGGHPGIFARPAAAGGQKFPLGGMGIALRHQEEGPLPPVGPGTQTLHQLGAPPAPRRADEDGQHGHTLLCSPRGRPPVLLSV